MQDHQQYSKNRLSYSNDSMTQHNITYNKTTSFSQNADQQSKKCLIDILKQESVKQFKQKLKENRIRTIELMQRVLYFYGIQKESETGIKKIYKKQQQLVNRLKKDQSSSSTQNQ